MDIRFGTSGWRAVIADEFTFENVRKVVNAICSYLKTQEGHEGGTIIVGHDSRFMGEKFSEFAAELMARYGFHVLFCAGPTPTPTISHAILSRSALGALNFTASHNPPEYQGIKFSTADGAPALPEITRAIEELVRSDAEAVAEAGGSVEAFNPKEAYFADLRTKVRFEALRTAGGRYAYDALWGTGRGYLNTLIADLGLEIETINDHRDVLFGGRSPEPSEEKLFELRERVTSKGLTLGLSTDGDADRFGVIDADGTFITANKLIALLADYLIESRGWKLGLARSVATSHLIDRVAELHDVELHETPVGFKFIGELINENALVLGGEESAGLSIRGHYPEKDGILACLLAAEAVAERKASLGEQLEELYRKTGKLESERIGVKLDKEIAAKLKTKLAEDPTEIAGRRIRGVNRLDGVKFLFEDGSWILMRPSGTEPMVRIYAESESREELNELLEAGKSYLLGH
ncbi:MAG TPA: phosphoglucomutase [Blastocatellia bacterium]|nr:phosphoglucomutase [Blastocatellia bacterium]